jgi:pseudouridine-5'-phosphate glycosidase
MCDRPSVIKPAEEVVEALAQRRPVVALESTIVAHGMPWPRNLETARALEAAVREAGAVPATIAVIGGKPRIGLSPPALERLARDGARFAKLSRADLAFAVAEGRDGATTVAATMFLASLAGIRVFATGGIGGVHRGVEASWDISADLAELARTPVAVVCAGAKAILDLPKTLEMLETLGVPVVGYRTDEFPAFWSCGSGLRVPLRLDDAASVARLIETQRRLRLGAGVLVANPIPAEAEIPREKIEPAIAAALLEAQRRRIEGKAVTPFLLERVLDGTEGRSLEANIALARNNAGIAAEIAVALRAFAAE